MANDNVSELVSPDWSQLLQAYAQRMLAKDADGAHDLGHLRRVHRNCLLIGEHEPCDPAVLSASAWLHDLVDIPKDDPRRADASRLSADAAIALLDGMGFPANRLADVHHAILAHSFSANIEPRTPEARVLQDADRLDALGAVGIARCFHVGGQLGRALFDAGDPFAESRELDDKLFTLDHFKAKLLRLSDAMRTETGRHLARERTKVMSAWLDALAIELR